MQLVRTTSDNSDFKMLTQMFDTYLIDIDGDEKDFFAQYNQIYLKNVVVCYEDALPVGCGALKTYDSETGEIKRMFVHPEHRNKGVAHLVLEELERWAEELHFTSCILETSFKLENAIALYKKFGYQAMPNYGQYIGVSSSVCMRKNI
ncbi:N-acetyltransferase GCN5 [Flavobacterium cauense R2A-7]|uniref:N-acetylglutamate synthase-like GNAT family acetyltransferase n=1 Tax=Flavobacterium cauense R2A-7 TaxID=1341154 RepID=V6RZR7_9FLAO|nr:GNAT family N-acetyltransferase [Flavobacterium cauense]ESU19971.1 N-acetyltransferase GCN5 [Flavobacterium cauense R2A-7]KGO83777.1 GNAT family acetyltransferase [Flavobacterium cauense R2A-7]TWI12395.1 N-acetylglutamate synthase-like GNAT family acetyltransferase [Flavobacterium cauense R2A-7]